MKKGTTVIDNEYLDTPRLTVARDDCRISLFMRSFAGGGAERVMVSLANLLASRGSTVDLVVVNDKGPLSSEIIEKVRVVNLAGSSAIRSIPSFARYVRREQPSVIMSTVENIDFAMLLSVLLFRLKVRTVTRLANAPTRFGEGDKSLKRLLIQKLWFRILRFNRRADAVVAVSEGVAKDFCDIVGEKREKLHVIYNPVLALPLNDLAKEPVPLESLFEQGTPVVISVGRLEPQKDFSTLIRAFSLVAKKRVAKLCILGEGSERSALEFLSAKLGIASLVFMPGFDQNPFKFVARSNVFVLSSLYEGLPNALVQALALKVPIVATDCKHGPREILDNGKWGILVEPGDFKGMAKAIDSQLDNPKSELPDSALTRYVPSVVVQQYYRVLCDTISEPDAA